MLRCDFCGRESDNITRVALDQGYDRLTVKHEKRYACQDCSLKKEQERQARLKAGK
ncbi:MAG: hypothetical protein H3C68_03930 [Deltaproteobacteria bacterium]|nr:hypothetical protein [Deltaproteobacteria bacterium]MBZ0219874.1 hypothetical protein [Deltaproteobacteria bacterium]